MSRTRAGLAAMAVAAMLAAGCSNTITKTFTG
jgi:predicted small secreted protein